MYHYVYYSYEDWGRGYIGVRSCKCLPENDFSYFGSFYDKTFAPTNKIILDLFEDRESALAAEIALHKFYRVHKNSHFANLAMQTSTKFVSNGEGLKVCVERNPNFHSDAGKIGGKVTHEKHPEMYSVNGKKVIKKLRQWHKDNPEESLVSLQKAAQASVSYFQNNPEAAKKRAANGWRAMQKHWETHERNVSSRRPVTVTLPAGEILSFRSKTEARKHLNIPSTTWKRLQSGKLSSKSKWNGYHVQEAFTTD